MGISQNYNITSVIRQKGKSQSRCFKKTKQAKFSEKRKFLTPWYAHVRKQKSIYVLLNKYGGQKIVEA